MSINVKAIVQKVEGIWTKIHPSTITEDTLDGSIIVLSSGRKFILKEKK